MIARTSTLIALATLLVASHMAQAAQPIMGWRPQESRGRQEASPRLTPVVRAVRKVAPSVVSISTKSVLRSQYSPWDELFQQSQPRNNGALRDQALGSGVIVDPKGYVITNDHVVGRADKITVTLSDGMKYPATLIGSDPENDIAILKIVGSAIFPAATLAQNNDLMLGEPTIALGNPFGLQGSVTTGVLSAVGRSVHLRNKKVFEDFIQTSAVINPGNSGGPLLNILGEVIGINVAIHSRGPGIGFAIPINRVRETVYKILDPRVTRKANLGFAVDYTTEKQGIPVSAVSDRGPAATCGLQVGDLILGLNNTSLSNWIDLQTTVASLQVGTPMKLTIQRDGESVTCTLSFEVLPEVLNQRRLAQMAGFTFTDLSTAQKSRFRYRISGVIVADVIPGSSAAAIGLQKGDVVFSMAGYAVKNADVAWRLLESFDEGKDAVISIRLIRGGERFQGALGLNR